MSGSIAVHGHFYQPPRENPWTGEIDPQPSAAPFANWNERVHAECYRPNAFSVVPTDGGERSVNNFERLSFNVGPTLLSWIEVNDPDVYERIRSAARTSRGRLGHSNVIAQAFHHSILPLGSLRDARTEVRWGIADYQHRFGMRPEGMWLPETAADHDVLDMLIDEGIAFTILAPNQAARWREPGGEWTTREEATIDPCAAYRHLHRDGSGRSLAVFFYDGDIARAIAFERAGSSADGFLELFATKTAEGLLVHAATDGETYGHHHRFSDLGLAYALFVEAERRELMVTNYGAYLAQFPPTQEVEIVPGTSWSCAHGIGRWQTDCGCSTGGEQAWNQRWRGPLRAALEVVEQASDDVFERLGGGLFRDPWHARDAYVDVVIGRSDISEVLSREALGPLSNDEVRRANTLLDLQRNTLAMFTSCGWFFNDVGGIETVQVLRYAGRVLDLLDELDQPTPEPQFLSLLERAKSNDPDKGTGADIYLDSLRTSKATLL